MLLFHVLFIFLKIHMNILVLFILTSSFASETGSHSVVLPGFELAILLP